MPKGKKGSTPIGKCLDCQQVKTIYVKGLCLPCYSKRKYYSNKKPYSPKICACGCGQSFIPNHGVQKFKNPRHQQKAKRRKIHQEYLGYLFCLKCGKLGSVYSYRYNRTLMFIQIQHRIKKKYSHACYIPLK